MPAFSLSSYSFNFLSRYSFQFYNESILVFSSPVDLFFSFILPLRIDIFSCNSLLIVVFFLKLSSFFIKASFDFSSSVFSSLVVLSRILNSSSNSLLKFLSYSLILIALSNSLSKVSTFLFKSTFSFWSRLISCEAFSIATSIMLFSLSLLFFISYYNICSMSFEFNSKIQNLTTKLQGLQQNGRKSVQLGDVKDQLRKLSESIQKQLLQAEKRIFKIENRLDKCQDNSRRSSRAIDNVWNDKEQKVSQIIGGWVDQYEEKAEQARNILIREEMTYKIKLQEQQDVIAKEMRMQENRVKDLIHILEKEMNKLKTINAQNCTAISKEIAAAKQSLQESMKHIDHLREERTEQIQLRLGKMREGIQSRCRYIKQDITGKSTKLKQVLKLLLQII